MAEIRVLAYSAKAMLNLWTLAALASISVPLAAAAAPIHIRLIGDIEFSYARSGFELPSFVVEGTSVNVDFEFEPLVLGSDGGGSGSAIIELAEGSVSIGVERLQMTGGNLFVSDNRAGGVCAGFSCATWQDDAIQVLGYGEAFALGEGVTFATSGGLLARASTFSAPSIIAVGTDLADQSIWNSFPPSSFYLRLKSEDGSNLGGVTAQVAQAVFVPEPATILLLVVGAAGIYLRRRVTA